MQQIQFFKKLKEQFRSEKTNFSDHALVLHGDSLEVLKRFPDHSISLILTDPPYHSTKKSNITGDKAFKTDSDFLDWMRQFIKEWKRILKPNGSIYCFCSPAMAGRLETIFFEEFNVLNSITWTKPNEPGFDGWKQKMKKESLRQWYPHTERIIFAEPAYDGNLHRSWFGSILRRARNEAKLSGHQLTELTGSYGSVNHGGAVSNWETGRNIPSRIQYKKIVEILKEHGVNTLPQYEDAIRPFAYIKGAEFTDVWTHPSVRPYSGKHPAEKPLSMLEQVIASSSYPGDIVLDCFSGSGNTLVAAMNTGRLAIGIDIEEKWVLSARAKLKETSFKMSEISKGSPEQLAVMRKTEKSLQAKLF